MRLKRLKQRKKQVLKLISLWMIFWSLELLYADSEVDTMTLWKAEDYDENSRLQQTIAENFLKLLEKHLRSPAKNACILDVGCGTGRVTKLILSYFPKGSVIGIDSSKEMIEFAHQHYADTKVSFNIDRAEKLATIDSSSVDAITSFSCLHWVHDQQAAFNSMHRVLKPGGWIGLMFAAETGYDDPIDHAYLQAIQESPWRDYFTQSQGVDWNIVEPKIIKAQLEDIGFEIVFTGVQNFDLSFKDLGAFEAWILACFQQLKLLPVDLQMSCAKRIAKLYLQSTLNLQPKEPQCIYQVDAFMVMAIKPSYLE